MGELLQVPRRLYAPTSLSTDNAYVSFYDKNLVLWPRLTQETIQFV